MKKNDFITAEIENIGANGEGVLHFNGTTVFVPFALVGEKITAKILKVKGNIAFAKISEILQPAPNRILPKCSVFSKCGGCNLQHMDYSSQLEYKRQTVENCLKKIGRINFPIDNTVPSPRVYGYRNKLQLPVRQKNGEIQLGFFREGSHNVVDINECPLHPNWNKTIIAVFREFIKKYDISCYDDQLKSGLVKHLVVREVFGKLLIVVVISGEKLPHSLELISMLKKNFNDFSLILNINKKDTNVIFGDKFTCIFGDEKIALDEFGINYSIGAQSFMQVNDLQKINLYNKVFQLGDIDADTVVIDGYSGAGVLTAMLARNAKKAYGVEIIAEAVASAIQLAKDNGLDNKMSSICGDCAEVLPDIIKNSKNEGAKTLLVLDPPRKGVDLKIIQQILINKPDKIIYVSCSPQSLARDLGLIMGTLKFDNGQIVNSTQPNGYYEITSLTPFDMFPNTKHVESVVCLSRK